MCLPSRICNILRHLSSVFLTHFRVAAMSHRDLAACTGNAWNIQCGDSHRWYAINIAESQRRVQWTCASDSQKRCRHQPLVGTLRCMIGPKCNALALVRVILYKYALINVTTFLIYGRPVNCHLAARSYFSPMYLFVAPTDFKIGTLACTRIITYTLTQRPLFADDKPLNGFCQR